MDSLETLGYTIIKNVLTSDQVKDYKTRFHTWWDFTVKNVPPHGVIQHYRIGHQPFVWKLRTEQSVQLPFKEIFGTNDLVASFDGWGYMPKNVNRRHVNWFHVDQAPKDPGFKSVQGVVALTTNLKIGRAHV